MGKISLRAYNQEIERLIDQGQAIQAIAHCQHILKFFPKHLDTYRLLGKAYIETHRYTEAADVLQRLLSSLPDDFISQVGMSIIHEDEGNLDAAIWHMERAFEAHPSNGAVQDELRRLYGRRDGMEPPKIRLTRGALVRMYARGELFHQAIAEIRASIAEDQQRIDLEVILAKMYYLSGDTVSATEVCGRIIKKLPYCYEINQLLAEILPKTARAEDADVFRQRLVAMDPYLAHVPPGAVSSNAAPEKSIMLDHLEWDGSKPAEATPEWAKTLGAPWADSEETLPDWFSEIKPEADIVETNPLSKTEHLTENIIEAELPSLPQLDEIISDQNRIAEEIIGFDANLEEIPDWMQNAGWTPASEDKSEVFDQIIKDDVTDPEPADLPSWLKSLEPLQTEEIEGEQSQFDLDILASILPEDTERQELLIKDDYPPIETSKPSDSDILTFEPALVEELGDIKMPDDLNTPPASTEEEPLSEAESDQREDISAQTQEPTLEQIELPQWLKEELSEDSAGISLEPSADEIEDVPEWLSPFIRSEGKKDLEEPVEDLEPKLTVENDELTPEAPEEPGAAVEEPFIQEVFESEPIEPIVDPGLEETQPTRIWRTPESTVSHEEILPDQPDDEILTSPESDFVETSETQEKIESGEPSWLPVEEPVTSEAIIMEDLTESELPQIDEADLPSWLPIVEEELLSTTQSESQQLEPETFETPEWLKGLLEEDSSLEDLSDIEGEALTPIDSLPVEPETEPVIDDLHELVTITNFCEEEPLLGDQEFVASEPELLPEDESEIISETLVEPSVIEPQPLKEVSSPIIETVDELASEAVFDLIDISTEEPSGDITQPTDLSQPKEIEIEISEDLPTDEIEPLAEITKEEAVFESAFEEIEGVETVDEPEVTIEESPSEIEDVEQPADVEIPAWLQEFIDEEPETILPNIESIVQAESSVSETSEDRLVEPDRIEKPSSLPTADWLEVEPLETTPIKDEEIIAEELEGVVDFSVEVQEDLDLETEAAGIVEVPPSEWIPEEQVFSTPIESESLEVTDEISEPSPDEVSRVVEKPAADDLPATIATLNEQLDAGEQPELIIPQIEQVLNQHPAEFDLWQLLGDAHMRANHLQEALDAYSKAEELLS